MLSRPLPVRAPFCRLVTILAGALALFGCKRTSIPETGPVPGEERVRRARALHEAELRSLCSAHHLPYPPAQIFLRAFKYEQVLEVWGGQQNQPLTLLFTFPLTASSGGPGPKRREGDRQIPEGCYVIDRFNPESKFHLSLGLNYPNESDLHFADPAAPGSDIFIHGSDRSIGCLAIGDEAIEKLFVLARDFKDTTGLPIPVHIFPARFSHESWSKQEQEIVVTNPPLAAFWDNLRLVYNSFEDQKRLPGITIDATGRYQLLRQH